MEQCEVEAVRQKISALLLALLMALTLFGCGEQSVYFITGEGEKDSGWTEPAESFAPEGSGQADSGDPQREEPDPEWPDEDGYYYDRDGVALYLYAYGCLPANYITKKEARALGWEGGSVERYAPDMAIGGDRFGNYEGLLPEEEGRLYWECDIDTHGADQRGPRRIVFSNDGLIYYTPDHYESFTLLYGQP